MTPAQRAIAQGSLLSLRGLALAYPVEFAELDHPFYFALERCCDHPELFASRLYMLKATFA